MNPKPLRPHLSFFLYYIDPDICEKENYEVNKLLNSKVASLNKNFLKLLFKLGVNTRFSKEEIQNLLKNILRNILQNLQEKKAKDDKYMEKIVEDIDSNVKSILEGKDFYYYRYRKVKEKWKQHLVKKLNKLKENLDRNDKNTDKEIFEEVKKVVKKELEKLLEEIFSPTPIIEIDQYLTRMNVREKYEDYVKTLSASLRNQYREHLIQVRIKVKKCVIGLGNKGPFEVGMTLHPIFGVPYIPGSAVKGIFKRAYLLWYDSIDKEERKKLDIPSSNDIFVPLNTSENPDKEDRLVFTDALPEPEKPGEICLDVMCPHIKLDKEKGIISEFENPIPIQFWILKDAKLTFYVYPSVSACINGDFRKYIEVFRQFLENLRETSMGDFTVTRTTNGEWLLAFGAKTSSGYGIFKIEEVKFND